MKKLFILLIGFLIALNLFAATTVHRYALEVIEGITSDYYIWGDSIFVEGSGANPDTTYITNFFEISDFSEKMLQIMHSTGLKDTLEVAYQPLVQLSDTLDGGGATEWIVKDSILPANKINVLDFTSELRGIPKVRFRVISTDVDAQDANCGFYVRFIGNNPYTW
jgi:hypothetical protein